jgi:hypothetical protein
MKKAMKKFLFVTVCLFLAAAPARADQDIPLLEVEGVLLRLDEPKGKPMEIVLDIDGEEAAGPLARACLYLDARDRKLNRDDFMERFVGTRILVGMNQSPDGPDPEAQIVRCRPAPPGKDTGTGTGTKTKTRRTRRR